MKFKLTESFGYSYTSDDPRLSGYELELDPDDLYERLTKEFTLEEIAQILVDYNFLEQSDIDPEKYELETTVQDCILFDMSIYALLSIYEFQDIVQNFIWESESEFLQDIEDAKWFRDTHGPEI